MKVTADEDRFRGHVMCLILCPERLRLADSSDVPAGLGAAVKYALANCPGQTNVEIAY